MTSSLCRLCPFGSMEQRQLCSSMTTGSFVKEWMSRFEPSPKMKIESSQVAQFKFNINIKLIRSSEDKKPLKHCRIAVGTRYGQRCVFAIYFENSADYSKRRVLTVKIRERRTDVGPRRSKLPLIACFFSRTPPNYQKGTGPKYLRTSMSYRWDYIG